MAIRAIIWDMGGVLLHMGDESPRQELEQSFGISLKKMYWAIFDSPSAQVATLGKITVREHWKNVGLYLGVPQEKLTEFLNRFWSTDYIDQAAIEFIRLLRRQFKIGLLSNAWDNLRQLINETWLIENGFDDLVISAEVGLAKPDNRIYRLAVERLGVKPDEAIFIDDVKGNIFAARESGLHAIHYKNRTQVVSELLSILINQGQRLSPEVLDLGQKLMDAPYPVPLDPNYLIHLQVNLEYGLDPHKRLVSYPGSSEQARLVIYQTQQKYTPYFHFSIAPEIRQNILNLGLDKVFTATQAIREVLQGFGNLQPVSPVQAYYFSHTPAATEFPDVHQRDGRFDVLVNNEIAAWAWSVRENGRCAEVAVETIPEYRLQSYARQATSAWAHSVIQQGRVALFSHKVDNDASRALAGSLGIVPFAICMSYE